MYARLKKRIAISDLASFRIIPEENSLFIFVVGKSGDDFQEVARCLHARCIEVSGVPVTRDSVIISDFTETAAG